MKIRFAFISLAQRRAVRLGNSFFTLTVARRVWPSVQLFYVQCSMVKSICNKKWNLKVNGGVIPKNEIEIRVWGWGRREIRQQHIAVRAIPWHRASNSGRGSGRSGSIRQQDAEEINNKLQMLWTPPDAIRRTGGREDTGHMFMWPRQRTRRGENTHRQYCRLVYLYIYPSPIQRQQEEEEEEEMDGISNVIPHRRGASIIHTDTRTQHAFIQGKERK